MMIIAPSVAPITERIDGPPLELSVALDVASIVVKLC